MNEQQAFTPVVVRLAFVIANLTTYFDEARDQVGDIKVLKKIVQVTINFLIKDENPEPIKPNEKGIMKKEDTSLGSVEDSLVKLIRLLANICTEEKYIT